MCSISCTLFLRIGWECHMCMMIVTVCAFRACFMRAGVKRFYCCALTHVCETLGRASTLVEGLDQT